MEKKGILVTTVHGTFARRAKWVMDNSVFSSRLVEKFGADCIVEPFHWSGRNSFKDRIRHADSLYQHLITQKARYPEKEQVLIGHSHGGSVIAYCLKKHPELIDDIKGTAFLATPIIVAKERKQWASIVRVIKYSLYVLINFLIMVLLWDMQNYGAAAGLVTLIGTILAIHYMFFPKSFLVKEKTRTAVNDKIKSVNLGKIKGRNFLFIGHPEDEVARLFRFLDFFTKALAAIPSRLVRRVEKWIQEDWVDGIKGTGAYGGHPPLHRCALPFIAFFVSLSAGPILDYGPDASSSWSSSFSGPMPFFDLDNLDGGAVLILSMLGLGALVVLYMIVTLMLVIAMFIPVVLSYFLYGELNPNYTFGIELSLSEGAGMKYKNDNIKWDLEENKKLAHSVVYEDSNSIEAVIDWLDSIGNP